MRIIICDDEAEFVTLLNRSIQNEVQKYNNIEIEITSDTNANNILKTTAAHKYDAAFIDIEMPEFNGLELAGELRQNHNVPYIIFVTNRDDLVFEALQFHPFGFIRKNRLNRELAAVISDMADELARSKKFIMVKGADGQVKVKYSDIMYLEKFRNNLIIHTMTQNLELRESISKVASEFSTYGFIFCHQGYVVNTKYVHELRDETFVLSNGEIIPISRRRYKSAKEAFAKEMLRSYE